MANPIAAYFDLDGTLIDASSEKTLTGVLGRKRPWRIPYASVAWSFGLISNLLRGRSFYDAARNRGHFSLASWDVLERFSKTIAQERLALRVTKEAREALEWHKSQGHRLVFVTATIAPMAEAMADVLGMDEVYGCGPERREGVLSGSERGWSVPRRKGKIAVVKADAQKHNHRLEECYGYGNTMADSWFMRTTGHPIAINAKGSFKKFAQDNGWEMHDWKIQP